MLTRTFFLAVFHLVLAVILVLLFIMLAHLIGFVRCGCTWVMRTAVRMFASPGSCTPLAMRFAAAVTRGGSVGRWRLSAHSSILTLVVVAGMSSLMVVSMSQPRGAACGPLAGLTTSPSCRRTSTSRRP